MISSVFGRTCFTDLASSMMDFTSISTSKCPAFERMAPSLIDLTAEYEMTCFCPVQVMKISP